VARRSAVDVPNEHLGPGFEQLLDDIHVARVAAQMQARPPMRPAAEVEIEALPLALVVGERELQSTELPAT